MLIGVLIGMITTVVVFQAFSLNERQKRVTTGAADAQTNGALALFSLERDVRMAGFGLETDFAAKCNTTYSYFDNGGGAAGPIPGMDAVAPLIITDGGGNSDQIAIVYFADPADSSFLMPSYTELSEKLSSPPSSPLSVSRVGGCRSKVKNDLAIVQEAGNCMVMQITDVDVNTKTIQHVSGSVGTVAAPKYNPDDNYMKNWPGFNPRASVRCGVYPPLLRTYRVNPSRVLEAMDGNGSALPLVPEIVGLQAQYGISGAVKINKVNSWVNPIDTWAAAALTREKAKLIKAVRVAVVARSSEYEKPLPGQGCATTTQAMLDAWSDWADFSSVTALPDWQCYRYKAFETVIPLRNMLWAEF